MAGLTQIVEYEAAKLHKEGKLELLGKTSKGFYASERYEADCFVEKAIEHAPKDALFYSVGMERLTSKCEMSETDGHFWAHHVSFYTIK